MARTVKRAAAAKSSPKPDYREKAAQLRKLGFKPSYGRPGGSLPHKKAAMTRQLNALAAYLPNPKTKESRFVFVKAPARTTKKLTNADARTPAGMFVQRPTGIAPKDFRARVTKDGRLVTWTKGAKSGKVRHDEVISVPTDKVAADPQGTIAAALAGKGAAGKQVILMINGHEGLKTYDPKQFFAYIKRFQKQVMEGSKRGHTSKEGMSLDEFNDTFHIKLVDERTAEDFGMSDEEEFEDDFEDTEDAEDMED